MTQTVKTLLEGIVGRLVRQGITAGATLVAAHGVAMTDSWQAETTSLVVAGVMFLISLLLSRFSDKAVAKKAVGGDPVSIGSSSSRIGPPPAIVLLALAVGSILMVGCAGQTARQKVLGPAVVAIWPDVKTDAQVGINAQEADGSIGPGVAQSKRERLRLFDEAVAKLGG